ncbi:FAD-dependent oxidoreductase [Gammaproteobacteria bacterium]|nr:FAD-dependent oxidoreductase [Gammaproteobacteria bacterium]
MKKSKIILVLAIAAVVVVFFAFGLERFLDPDFLKQQQDHINNYYHENPWRTISIYFLTYVLMAALSLPGAVWVTLIGGAIFGVVAGTIIISFASTIGATLALLVARFLLRDWVQDRFGNRLKTVNKGIEQDGAFYLFTLRMVPLFPFWLINLLMGLTRIPVGVFYLVSQIGMLTATVIYVNAGSQLARIDSLSGILSPSLLVSLSLLGIFPLLAKKLISMTRARKVYRGYPKPASFDRNIVVIGAGSAGLVAANIAAAVKARVTLIEKGKMGGDCLNTGCVPSKALIRSAKYVSHIKRAREFGMNSAAVDFDFADVMERIQSVIRKIEPHDSVERYTGLGVDVIKGEGRIVAPWHVEVNGKTICTRNIVIAAGAGPLVPPIPGIEDIDFWTSDNVWSIRELPRRLIVLGGGPIGCELAQSFARLGSKVTQVEMLPRLLTREDTEISKLIQDRFVEEGVDVRVEHRATAFKRGQDQHTLVCDYKGEQVEIEFDHLLVALGRKPNTSGYGLEELGIPLTRSGTIEVDEYLRTRFPNIYVCGDVCGPYQFTHVASHQAWFASVNALFGAIKMFRADYSVIPWATFTEPEIARVGLNELDAGENNVPYEVTTYNLGELDRAVADQSTEGMVKVLTVPGKDKILGATIVGEHAGDMLPEFVTAMKYGLGLNKILGTIHTYPTLSEANKYAAGKWKRAHAPRSVLKWLEKYHNWQRS